MIKRTFLIGLANGDSHTVEADKLLAANGEVSLLSGDCLVAYFHNVSAVFAKPEPDEQPPAPTLREPLSVLASVSGFEPRQTIEIGTLNITCPAGKPENVAEIIRAIAGVHIVPGTV